MRSPPAVPVPDALGLPEDSLDTIKASAAGHLEQRVARLRQLASANLLDTEGDAWTVSEPTTWSEICERFSEQWVALVALDWTDDRDEPFRTALIAGCGSRVEALAQARPLLKLFDQLGPFFTGPPAARTRRAPADRLRRLTQVTGFMLDATSRPSSLCSSARFPGGRRLVEMSHNDLDGKNRYKYYI